MVGSVLQTSRDAVYGARHVALRAGLPVEVPALTVAIALGHPLGMTGTRPLLTLALELGRRGATYGLATAGIGGGQGIAAIIERLA